MEQTSVYRLNRRDGKGNGEQAGKLEFRLEAAAHRWI
jgi:hypothetical protein